MTETIVAAAVRSGALIFSVPRPGRHHHVLHAMDALGIDAALHGYDQGFLTSTGRYVGREDAFSIASAANQILSKNGPAHQLFSEDVWNTPPSLTRPPETVWIP